jgi:hypothetical protein
MRLKSLIENSGNADINEEGMKHCMHEEHITIKMHSNE